MSGWISVDERLPEQEERDGGLVSRVVKVLLNTGEESEDWLINGRWVLYCKNNIGGEYPTAWKDG